MTRIIQQWHQGRPQHRHKCDDGARDEADQRPRAHRRLVPAAEVGCGCATIQAYGAIHRRSAHIIHTTPSCRRMPVSTSCLGAASEGEDTGPAPGVTRGRRRRSNRSASGYYTMIGGGRFCARQARITAPFAACRHAPRRAACWDRNHHRQGPSARACDRAAAATTRSPSAAVPARGPAPPAA